MAVTLRRRTLLDLPDELLIQILTALPSQHDLFSVCLVSRRLNSLTDPVLHKSILFDQPKHHLTFSESLLTRPRRGSLIQNVRIEYPSSELSDFMFLTEERGPGQVDRFSHTLSTMSNLEELTISVPDSLCRAIGNLFNHPFDLACLKSCSLYYHCEGGAYWDLQENIHIFSHPTLETLTITHARLDERGFDSLEKPEETALQYLHLIECDINDEALTDILLHPETLKEITITQKAHPTPELEESPDDVNEFIFALGSAHHSLEKITIDFPTLGSKAALRLRDFDAVTELTIMDYQLLGLSSGKPRLHSVGLPPNLEILTMPGRVSEDEEILDLLEYMIENKNVLARKWRILEVEGDEEGLPARIREACEKAELQVMGFER